MKTKSFITLLATMMVSTSCMNQGGGNTTNKSDDYNGKTVKVSLDATEASRQSISPFVYGTFIEHIETCIYSGIWSELIMDRKFYKPVGTDVSQWNIQTGEVRAETVNPFEGDYSPIITIGSSIRQNGIALDQKGYCGYFYAKGSGKLQIKITCDDWNVIKEFDINNVAYKKFAFAFDSSVVTTKAKLYVSSLDGDITIDAMSLMPSDNYHGMRRDTLDLLKELRAPFYRWPGGNFVSGYDFYDGIGDRDTRPTRRNLNYIGSDTGYANEQERIAHDLIMIGSLGFYGAFEPNDYGLDEFIEMCRYIGAEPNIVLNSGLGNVTMARDEVEYCNSNTGYGLKRLSKEPYNVTYFSIGNEMNGSWQLGHMDISQYTKKHNEFAEAIKNVDPNIKIIGVGDNYSDWSQKMVNSCKDNLDYLSEHFYAERKENDVKEHILSLKNQAVMRIGKHRKLSSAQGIMMAIDEYAYENAEQPSRLKDGMGTASALNVMIENSDVVGLACYSSTVNATQGNLITDKLHAYMEGSGYALSLYSKNMQSHFVPLSYSMAKSSEDYYEISATINDDKSILSVAIINTSTEPLRVSSRMFKEVTKIDCLYGDSLESINSASLNELHREEISLSTQNITVRPLSISVATVNIKK